MTKQHFISLADCIRNSVGTTHEFSPEQIGVLADFCRSQNCQFKGERWIGYIQGKNGKNGGAVKECVR